MECPICAGPAARWSDTSYFKKPVYFCKGCVLYISEDDPTIYQQQYWDNRAAVASIESGYTDENSIYRQQLLDSQLAYCREFIKGSKVLEIGSGAGQTLYFMERKGYDVTGIEPDARNAELINQKLNRGHCVAGYGEQVAITERYDIIWMSHVFEHVQKPLMLLEKLSHHCDNLIFIEVPNTENPAILKASIYENPSSYHHSKQSLTELARRAHLQVLKSNHMRYMTQSERSKHKRLGILMKVKFPHYPYAVGKPEESEAIRIVLRPL